MSAKMKTMRFGPGFNSIKVVPVVPVVPVSEKRKELLVPPFLGGTSGTKFLIPLGMS